MDKCIEGNAAWIGNKLTTLSSYTDYFLPADHTVNNNARSLYDNCKEYKSGVAP